MYIVYTITHKMFAFDDIQQARRFRDKGNKETSDTWYISQADINYGLDEGQEVPCHRIDKAKFPKAK